MEGRESAVSSTAGRDCNLGKTSTCTAERAPLGEILRARGLISDDQLDEALAHQASYGLKLGQSLVALGAVTEVEIAEALCIQGKIPAIHLTPGIVDRAVAHELGADLSWRHSAVAINRVAGTVTVAMEDPTETSVVEQLERWLESPVLPVYAGPTAIRSCLEVLFPRGFEAPAKLTDFIADLDPDDVGPSVADEEINRFVDADDEQPVVQLVQGIIEDARSSRASDIHLEPRRERFVIRFRIDGALHERLSLPKFWVRPCISRLKVMAQLDITQRRRPQDGRILARIQGRRVDLRVATTETLEGEGAVVRILDGSSDLLTLEQLGFDTERLADLKRVFGARDGFILATGPSGSGKTTTLYSILHELNTQERKIVTLEDPVERELEEAFQISAQPATGLTFSDGLRAVLRLDPDVMMIGEIRDSETAAAAIRAALTGHMVLSSLATAGGAETIIRLQDLGIDRFLIADTVRAIISQRLVRRICRSCRQRTLPCDRVLDALRLGPDDGPFFAGRGCHDCNHTGVRGRLALLEVMTMDAELYALTSRQSSSNEIHAAAMAGGMKTLRADGIAKARAGQTTVEDVLAVTTGRFR